MRNAVKYGDLIATTDNAAAIGEKQHDVVAASDVFTAYLTARVTFLEQLCANALPECIILSNFSGDDIWLRYVEGIEQVFDEIGLEPPRVDGSSESNMPTLQSGLSITMLGKITKRLHYNINDLEWYTYGLPLVGEEVLNYPDDVAKLQPIFDGWLHEIVSQVWPVGSKGLQAEFKKLFGNAKIETHLDATKTAGPSAIVILGIQPEKVQEAKKIFMRNFEKLRIIGHETR